VGPISSRMTGINVTDKKKTIETNRVPISANSVSILKTKTENVSKKDNWRF